MNTFEQVKELIIEKLEVEASEVLLEASFRDDLRADSLDVVELVMELEDQFDIEVPDETAETLKTVKDVVDFIEKVKK